MVEKELNIDTFIKKNSIILSFALVLIINIPKFLTFSFTNIPMINSIFVLLILITVIIGILVNKNVGKFVLLGVLLGGLVMICFSIYVLTIMNKRPIINPQPHHENMSSIQNKQTPPIVGQSFSFGQQLINIIFTIIIVYLFLFIGGKKILNNTNMDENYIRLLIISIIGYFIYLLMTIKKQNNNLTKKYNKTPE